MADDPWNHVIDADGEVWRWKVEGVSTRHSSDVHGSEDTGLIRAAHSISALRWLMTDGPIYGYGDLDFDKEFTVTISLAAGALMASDSNLPAWAEIERRALGHLHASRTELTDVQDWLRSDWSPAGSELTDAQAEARSEVKRLVGQAKVLIDQAKRLLQREDGDD
jgi:hypothetical protein